MESRHNDQHTTFDEQTIHNFVSMLCEHNSNRSQRDLIISNLIQFIVAINSDKTFTKKGQLIAFIKAFKQQLTSLSNWEQSGLPTIITSILEDIENNGKCIRSLLKVDDINDVINRIHAIVEKSDAKRDTYLPRFHQIKSGTDSNPSKEHGLISSYINANTMVDKINEEFIALNLLIQESTFFRKKQDFFTAIEKCKQAVNHLERLHALHQSKNIKIAESRTNLIFRINLITMECGSIESYHENLLNLLKTTIRSLQIYSNDNMRLQSDISYLQLVLANFYFFFTDQPDQCHDISKQALDDSISRLIDSHTSEDAHHEFDKSNIETASHLLYRYYVSISNYHEALAQRYDTAERIYHADEACNYLREAIRIYSNVFQLVTSYDIDLITDNIRDIYERHTTLCIINGDIYKKIGSLDNALHYYNKANNLLENAGLTRINFPDLKERIQMRIATLESSDQQYDSHTPRSEDNAYPNDLGENTDHQLSSESDNEEVDSTNGFVRRP